MRRSIIIVLLVVLALAVVPWLRLPAFYEALLYIILHWIALATSWNLLSGYSGYFSFGHGALFGIGMYTTTTLTVQMNMPFMWTLPFAAIVAALFGTLLGAIAFRVRSVRAELFSLLTLAMAFVMATIILNTRIDGGPGVSMAGVAVPVFAPTASGTFYLLALGATAITMVAAIWVFYSRLGTGLFAIHDDEDVAEVMGVPTYRYKLLAFALSSALAGLGGGIHALFINYVTAGDVFNISLPLTVILMTVLGGTRHWAGPAVGATLITLLLYSFTGGDSAVIGKAVTGVVLIAVILFMPEGVLGQALKWFGARRDKKAAGKVEAGEAVAPVTTAPASAKTVSSTPSSASAVAAGEVLLKARGVVKQFKGVRALRGVDLEVRRGEILGLLGPNGSGKSTFINVASGHFAVTEGVIEFGGQRISDAPAHLIAHGGIARTYQIPRPFAHLTVLQNVALPAMFGAASLDRKTAEDEAWQWLEFTGLTSRAHALPDALNLHQRKFLELARALAARPQILMLDEVLSGLTPSEIDEAVALIRRIRDQGATIVFVEHVMRAVMALCDRIVVFESGSVLAEGAPHDVMQRPEVVAAYLGDAKAAAKNKPGHAAPGREAAHAA
ncbi:MAG: branched-chain amino acid ABC transporter ATP-binding protein/permease [Polaromonas sp.]|uniref:branched-chain amino acid ABC transporter ATP-binding protein/permease n=1 Tax=Polaromonas sp. TaxID=1869339 RepID=UPI0025DCE9F2|nr:branched-chain amino acid ABC transporter ATP-binding protein/permease [Polaromonas sp.]MBI2725030.1 branched-chain amino acid ABC transporter ATP-binding protein/permease [Polaromonas sp.]